MGFAYIFCLLLVGLCTAQYLHEKIDQDGADKDRKIVVRWCTVNPSEHRKCEGLSRAVELDGIRIGYTTFQMSCYQAFTKSECLHLLDAGNVTMTSLDPGEVFIGGRYNSLLPISQELTEGGLNEHYSVAVIKKNSLKNVRSMRDMRNLKGCFPGVDTMAGWTLPIYTFMKEGGMEILDCNNHVKTATEFFGPSCAVNSLSDKYNPIGDNSDKLCSLCIGKVPGGKCTDSDPYAGFEGAFKCLLEVGEVAFLKHYTVADMINTDEFSDLNRDAFELLCKDGSRRSVDDYRSCHWGTVPNNAIVTSSAVSSKIRKKFQKFLEKLASMYGVDDGNRQDRNRRQVYSDYRNKYGNSNSNPNDNSNNPYEQGPFSRDPHIINRDQYGINIDPYGDRSTYNRDQDDNYNVPSHSRNQSYFEKTFNLFESSPKFGDKSNLLFQDSTRNFKALDEKQQFYTEFLGRYMDIVMGIRDCPVNTMTLCVTSDVEMEKCTKMKIALKAQLLKPEMICFKGFSQNECMKLIQEGKADVTVLDASDVYTGGLNYNLVPFISEVYNLGKPEYYVVAVAKESDPDTELTYLKNKNTCHGGINTAAGWVYPLAYLLSNGWIRPYGCDSIRAAAEYFTKSCIPGALSSDYNTGVPYDNMCHLCHGTAYRYCRRDASEDYYGHTGAFRCLVEGGGDVAFVKHTTVNENTGGKRKEWWARDALMDDFELLCPDGTRAEVTDYNKCNLGKVKANAIVARGSTAYNETQINSYINLFLYAQTYYGRKIPDEFSFSMFHSPPPYTDLIFQDATTQLQIIPREMRYYSDYLGKDFMRARRVVDCRAGAANLHRSVIALLISSSLFAMSVLRH